MNGGGQGAHQVTLPPHRLCLIINVKVPGKISLNFFPKNHDFPP